MDEISPKLRRGLRGPWRTPFAHSYGRWWLNKQGIRLYRGKDRIYGVIPKLPDGFANEDAIGRWKEDIRKIPSVEVGNFKKSESVELIKDYGILREFGYRVLSERGKKGFGPSSKIYSLVPRDRLTGVVLTAFPKDHYVEYDRGYRTLRIVGKSSDNQIVFLEKKKDTQLLLENLSFRERSKMILGTLDLDSLKKKMISINELLVGYSPDDGRIVTIPLERDPPRMGFVGIAGGGKTICMHSIMNQLYHARGVPFIHLHDEKSESFLWSRALTSVAHSERGVDSDRFFIDRLDLFGLKPIGTPCIYFSPIIGDYTKEREEELELGNESMHYFISMDWENIIDNYNSYFGGFKEMELEKSGRYLDFDKLKKCKSEKEVYDLIDDIKDCPKEVRWKLQTIFKKIFSYKLSNINSEVESKFTYKKFVGDKQVGGDITENPFIVAVYAGLCPVLLTTKLKRIQFGNTNVVPAYIKSIVRQIVDFKRENILLKGKTIYVVIDELGYITRQGANEPIIDLATMGRSDDIGFMWANQTYSKKGLPLDVKDNTHYLFATKPVSEEDVKVIVKDYAGNSKYWKEVMNKVGKEGEKFECVLFHTEPVITYDLDNGDRKVVERDPIRMTMIPPLSKHKAPSKI